MNNVVNTIEKVKAAKEIFNGSGRMFTEVDGIVKEFLPDGTIVELSAEETAQVEAKFAELQADFNSTQYQRDRVYPSIQEQLDMQYWDSVNGTTTWADAIAAVKEANPKPE